MAAVANAQTSAPPIEEVALPLCAIEVSAVDALQVGLSLRTLARQRHMPAGTAEIYERFGKQLIAAANGAITADRRRK